MGPGKQAYNGVRATEGGTSRTGACPRRAWTVDTVSGYRCTRRQRDGAVRPWVGVHTAVGLGEVGGRVGGSKQAYGCYNGVFGYKGSGGWHVQTVDTVYRGVSV